MLHTILLIILLLSLVVILAGAFSWLYNFAGGGMSTPANHRLTNLIKVLILSGITIGVIAGGWLILIGH